MSLPKSEPQVGAWLAGKLGLANVPPALWQRLADRGYVRDALDHGTKEYFDALVEEARGLLELARDLAPITPESASHRPPTRRVNTILR